ncbi:hypothetical protein [Thaumasiovibrio subtropicus]|uniref:hypothetical protein n=1 Tax=Thaumasiovibrio subtropicus TaxID=1891207 RepID=UPI000B35E1B9|nr:hypothetical protein [Thaumasiovibrio subtropicus]
MKVADLHKGSRIDSTHGLADIIDIDSDNNTILVERCQDHQQMILQEEEILIEPQLHLGCDKYY